MKIAIDLDNTITKLSPAFLQEVEYNFWNLSDVNSKKYNLNKLTSNCWENFNFNYYQYYNLCSYFPYVDEKAFLMCYKLIFFNPIFWENLTPIEGAIEAIEVLNKEHEIFIVTHPYKNNDECKAGKLNWIKKNMPYIRRYQIVFDDKMNDLPYDLIIDDNKEVLKNSINKNIKTIKFSHEYNEEIDVPFIKYYWNIEAIEKIIENFQK